MEWDPELLAKLRELRESRESTRAKGFKGTKERSEPSTKATNGIIAIRQPGDDVSNKDDCQSVVH
jgi:hypothetical protein